MATLILLGLFFVAYKCVEEECVLLRAGDKIGARQWLLFRMTKRAIRDYCSFMAGVALFFAKMPFPNIFFSVSVFFAVIVYAARIIRRFEKLTASQNSF